MKIEITYLGTFNGVNLIAGYNKGGTHHRWNGLLR
jgi:hypothetical protein